MQLILGLGIAGFMIAVVFFTKLSSLPPHLRAAVIGVRTILVLAVVGICLIINHDQKQRGRNLWGNFDIDNKTFIGTWSIPKPAPPKNNHYGSITEAEPIESIFSFYPDSTFFNEGKTGSWWYSDKNEKLYLQYNGENKITDYKIYSFDNFKMQTLGNGSPTFTKLSSSPIDKEKIVEQYVDSVKQISETAENEEDAISSKNIAGTWSLKSVADWGTTRDLGMYQLNQSGTGTYSTGNSLQEEQPIKYRLDKDKRRLNLSSPDKVMILNIQKYDGEVLTGYQNEEPSIKYVFTKGI